MMFSPPLLSVFGLFGGGGTCTCTSGCGGGCGGGGGGCGISSSGCDCGSGVGFGGGGCELFCICAKGALGTCCSDTFCKKAITAASLAAAIDLSWTRRSCSRFILAISCALHASSLATRSRSRLSSDSINLFCISSCFSTTSFISLWKKSVHFLFLFRRLSGSSSEEVEEDDDIDMDSRFTGILR